MADNSEQIKKRVEWMTCDHKRSDTYIDGVREFLDFAFSKILATTNGEEQNYRSFLVLVSGAIIVIIK